FLEQRGIRRPDMIVIAGGALTLARPRSSYARDFVLQQIRLAVELHRVQRVVLMAHSDCATYGGLAAFQGDLSGENEHHRSALRPPSSAHPYHFDHLYPSLFFGAGLLHSCHACTSYPPVHSDLACLL